MSDQLSFLEEPPSRPLTDSLFFACFPTPVSDAMRRIAEEQRARHTLMGKLHAQDRLHLSMICLGEFSGLPERIVEIALAAGETVSVAPFELLIDRVESFSGKPGSCPRVLGCSAGLDRLTALHQALALGLKRARYAQAIKRLTAPHITLMYADRRVGTDAIAPIRWTVNEFVLVHSLLGKTIYQPLGRWPLRG
jgi:2'-5' RNA ligase